LELRGKSAVLRLRTTVNTSSSFLGVFNDFRPNKQGEPFRRITASISKLYPADGQGKIWWGRLKKALGTGSSDFVNASLLQLQAAAQFPGSGISEMGINAALAMIEGFAPQNQVEAALAIQMSCNCAASNLAVIDTNDNGAPGYRLPNTRV
jgi:hypothetical protein